MKHHITNLGAALSKLAIHEATETVMHADVSAFGAPSECHDLVAKGEAARRRIARRHAEAIACAPMRVIVREAIKRLGSQAAYVRACNKAEQRAFARLCPFDM